MCVYAAANPLMLQGAIARHLGITQSQVSRILRLAGHRRVRGRKPSRSPTGSDWELILHNAGLGMDRGLTALGQPLCYGHNYDL